MTVTHYAAWPGDLGHAVEFPSADTAREFLVEASGYLQEVEYEETAGGHVEWSNHCFDIEQADISSGEWQGEDHLGGTWAVIRQETCEHGLSAWLCSGPGHYSDTY